MQRVKSKCRRGLGAGEIRELRFSRDRDDSNSSRYSARTSSSSLRCAERGRTRLVGDAREHGKQRRQCHGPRPVDVVDPVVAAQVGVDHARMARNASSSARGEEIPRLALLNSS